MSNFRPINRDMDFLMPPSVNEWLPQRHLARFVVEVIEGLELRAMTGSDPGLGGAHAARGDRHLPGLRRGALPPPAFAGPDRLRLPHRGFFQPPPGTGEP